MLVDCYTHLLLLFFLLLLFTCYHLSCSFGIHIFSTLFPSCDALARVFMLLAVLELCFAIVLVVADDVIFEVRWCMVFVLDGCSTNTWSLQEQVVLISWWFSPLHSAHHRKLRKPGSLRSTCTCRLSCRHCHHAWIIVSWKFWRAIHCHFWTRIRSSQNCKYIGSQWRSSTSKCAPCSQSLLGGSGFLTLCPPSPQHWPS